MKKTFRTALLALPLLAFSLAPAAVTAGDGLNADEAKALLDYHNRCRAEVGVDPVVWSAEIARVAQAYADKLAASGEFEHSDTDYGENLGAGSGRRYNALSAARDWYDEKRFYAPGEAIPANFGSFKAGHYTQMVWSGTTAIGAGIAVMKTGEMKGWTVVVCNYNPPGNFTGETPYDVFR